MAFYKHAQEFEKSQQAMQKMQLSELTGFFSLLIQFQVLLSDLLLNICIIAFYSMYCHEKGTQCNPECDDQIQLKINKIHEF